MQRGIYRAETRALQENSDIFTGEAFLCGSAGKESACNAGDLGSIPELRRCPGEEKGYPLQYSGLENSVDQSPWGHKESDMDCVTFNFSNASVQFSHSVMSDSVTP